MGQKKEQKNPQKNAKKNPQEGKGLVITCVVIVVTVVVLLGLLVGKRIAGTKKETANVAAGTTGTTDETTDVSGQGSGTGENSGQGSGAGENSGQGNGAGENSGQGNGAADAIADPIYADITVEGYGTITVALDPSAAPATVENFVSLAESGFYDGLTFHRIIDGFMIQGGDPEGTGMGGADQTIVGEFAANGHDNPLSHVRGAISMARSQDYDSASSQFFIVQSDSTYLDGQYAAFGYVTSGMEYVDQICADAEPTDNNGSIAKENQPVITSVAIRREQQ